MQVVLVMFRSDGERRSFSVVRNMTIIGRREDCDLRIPVGDVSRKHCRLVRTDDGIRIEDLGSSNGTFVNGERLQESELHAGDTVGVGPVQFIVQIDGVPDEEEMTPPAVASRNAPPAPPEDSMMDHGMEHGTDDGMGHGADLEELAPEEEEFKLDEDEPIAAEAPPLMELDELPAEELTPEELSPDELAPDELVDDELPAEKHLSAESPASIAEEPLAGDDLEEFPLEEEEAAPAPTPKVRPATPPVPAFPAPVDAIDDFDDFELEEVPADDASVTLAAGTPTAVPAEESPAKESPAEDSPEDSLEDLGEFSLEEDLPPPVSPAAAPVAEGDHLEELELDESALEFEDAEHSAPHNAPAKPANPAEEPLELAPAAPAYEEVNIDSADEGIEELELEEEPGTHGKTEAASESSWDFVVEETDPSRSHHDFKLDLDSPHEQPHS